MSIIEKIRPYKKVNLDDVKPETMLRLFEEEYERLYECGDKVEGYSDAVDSFDEYIKDKYFLSFVGNFNRLREDVVTSDREAAAFMFAMNRLF